MASRLLKLRWLIAIAAALSLVAAVACGSADEEEPTTAATDTTVPDTTVPDVLAASDTTDDEKMDDSAAKADDEMMEDDDLGYVAWTAPTYGPGDLPTTFYDGPRPTKFTESPKLAEMVRKGLPCGTYHGPSVSPSVDGGPQPCPAVEDRLPVPEDVLVMAPPYEIGIHGGMKRFYTTGGQVVADLSSQALFTGDGARAGKTIELSDDGRTYTATMRDGWKWSDGKPIDIEDFRIAWEDFNYNKELHPDGLTYPGKDGVTGNDPTFAVVDANTWSLTYDTPNYTMLEGKWSGRPCWGCRGGWSMVHAPFFTQFHPKYADPADLKAQQEYWGVDSWTKVVFRFHPEFGQAVPVIGNFATPVSDWRVGWGTKCSACPAGEFKTTHPYTLANPFFGAVDPQGNQLPYLDGAETEIVESKDVEVFRALAGESDGPRCCWGAGELPLWHKSMESGDISIFSWIRLDGHDATYTWNHDYNTDPEIGRLVRTKDFRQAMSVAIDREAINEAVFAGLATVQNHVPHPSVAYYPGPEWASFEIEQDQAKAKDLFKNMGYTDGDGDGWFDRLDGTGALTIEFSSTADEGDDYLAIGELVKADWEAIGVKVDLTNESLNDRYKIGDYYLSGPYDDSYGHSPWTIDWSKMFPMYSDRGPSPKSGAYYYTGGEEGWAPTGGTAEYTDIFGKMAPADTYPTDILGDWVRLQDIHREGKQLPEFDPRRIDMGKEVYRTLIEGFYHIELVGFKANVGYVRNNVRNWHREGLTAGYGHNNELHYFEDGIDNVSHPGNRSKKYSSWSFALQ